jgi:acetoin utilization deacetylase AcuC-like enzyme
VLGSLFVYSKCEVKTKKLNKKTNMKNNNNNNTANITVTPFVRDLVSLCAIHPADFVREIGKAESLKDNAKSVSVSKGTAISAIVKGAFAKGTHKSVIEGETARWEALSAISNALGMRLGSLLRLADVETGDSTVPALKAPQEASQTPTKA